MQGAFSLSLASLALGLFCFLLLVFFKNHPPPPFPDLGHAAVVPPSVDEEEAAEEAELRDGEVRRVDRLGGRG